MPRPGSFVVKYGSKSRARVSLSMPHPVSLTASMTTWLTLAVSIVRRPPCGIASRALTTRFMITCPI